MKDDMTGIMRRLSSRRVLERKDAIKALRERLSGEEAYFARLCLQYVSEHDPCYTVRNIARQAFYRISAPPEGDSGWEKAYIFQSE
ncbi:MAG: hypothetical protein AB1324_00075 [Candidatus Micrarchaeota archaeon]